MNLELNDTERRLLQEILIDRLGTLRAQIHHATISTFKDKLKANKELLNELIRKLEMVTDS